MPKRPGLKQRTIHRLRALDFDLQVARERENRRHARVMGPVGDRARRIKNTRQMKKLDKTLKVVDTTGFKIVSVLLWLACFAALLALFLRMRGII